MNKCPGHSLSLTCSILQTDFVFMLRKINWPVRVISSSWLTVAQAKNRLVRPRTSHWSQSPTPREAEENSQVAGGSFFSSNSYNSFTRRPICFSAYILNALIWGNVDLLEPNLHTTPRHKGQAATARNRGPHTWSRKWASLSNTKPRVFWCFPSQEGLISLNRKSWRSWRQANQCWVRKRAEWKIGGVCSFLPGPAESWVS